MSGESNQRSGSLSRAERGRRSLEHTWIDALGCVLSPHGSTDEGELVFQGSWLHTFSSSSWMGYSEGG